MWGILIASLTQYYAFERRWASVRSPIGSDSHRRTDSTRLQMRDGRRLIEDLLLIGAASAASDAAQGVDSLRDQVVADREAAARAIEGLAAEQARLSDLLDAQEHRRTTRQQNRQAEAEGRRLMALGRAAMDRGSLVEAADSFNRAATVFPPHVVDEDAGLFARSSATVQAARALSRLGLNSEAVRLLAPLVEGVEPICDDPLRAQAVNEALRDVLDRMLTDWEHASARAVTRQALPEVRRLRSLLYELDPARFAMYRSLQAQVVADRIRAASDSRLRDAEGVRQAEEKQLEETLRALMSERAGVVDTPRGRVGYVVVLVASVLSGGVFMAVGSTRIAMVCSALAILAVGLLVAAEIAQQSASRRLTRIEGEVARVRRDLDHLRHSSACAND